MHQLIGRKFMRDKELQYYILGGGKKGYMVEICEITHIRKVEALLPGGFAGWRKAREFARRICKETVLAEHLKCIVEDYIEDNYTFPEDAT